MKSNTIMWLVIGGIAFYWLYNQQQQQAAQQTQQQIGAAGSALGELGTLLTDV